MDYRIGYKFSFQKNKPGQTPKQTPKFVSIEIDPNQLHSNSNLTNDIQNNNKSTDNSLNNHNLQNISQKKVSNIRTTSIRSLHSSQKYRQASTKCLNTNIDNKNKIIYTQYRDLAARNKKTVEKIFSKRIKTLSKQQLTKKVDILSNEKQKKNNNHQKSLVQLWSLREDSVNLQSKFYNFNKLTKNLDKQRIQKKTIRLTTPQKRKLTKPINQTQVNKINKKNMSRNNGSVKIINPSYLPTSSQISFRQQNRQKNENFNNTKFNQLNNAKLSNLKPITARIKKPLFLKQFRENDTNEKINKLVDKLHLLSIQTQVDIDTTNEKFEQSINQ